MEAFGLQFTIESLNEPLDCRTLKFEPKFANRLGEDFLKFGSDFLQILHRGYSEFYTTKAGWRRQDVPHLHIVSSARMAPRRE